MTETGRKSDRNHSCENSDWAGGSRGSVAGVNPAFDRFTISRK